MPSPTINELVLSTFSDSNKQVTLQFLRELEEYVKSKQILHSLKLPLTAHTIKDTYSKAWLLAIYHDVKVYEQFRENFTILFWSKLHHSHIRCAIY
jgi:hypothetical protein